MQSRVREYAEADSSLAVLSGEIERALSECALACEKAVLYQLVRSYERRVYVIAFAMSPNEARRGTPFKTPYLKALLICGKSGLGSHSHLLPGERGSRGEALRRAGRRSLFVFPGRCLKATRMIKPNESDVNIEATLVRSVCEGDREAFILLVRPWERAAFLAANAVVTNANTAEEIVQAAILEALSSLRVLQPSGKFGVWLIQITIDRARKRTAEGDGKVQDPAQKPSIDDEVDYVPQDLSSWLLISSETLENTEHRLALEHAFVCLPQECREVLALQDVAHLSHNQTAEALGLSLGQVKARLRRARLQLRDALAPGNGGKWSNGSALAHDQKAVQASGGATGLSPA